MHDEFLIMLLLGLRSLAAANIIFAKSFLIYTSSKVLIECQKRRRDIHQHMAGYEYFMRAGPTFLLKLDDTMNQNHV